MTLSERLAKRIAQWLACKIADVLTGLPVPVVIGFGIVVVWAIVSKFISPRY